MINISTKKRKDFKPHSRIRCYLCLSNVLLNDKIRVFDIDFALQIKAKILCLDFIIVS